MLFDIILRKTWKKTGKKVFLFKAMTKDEIRQIAGQIDNFKLDFMVIESR